MVAQLTIRQATSPDDLAQLRDLLRKYILWAFTLEEGSEEAPTFRNVEEELAGLPGPYAPPVGRLLIATSGATVVGCVCLKPVDSETAEVKRLYVAPSARGSGAGKALIESLVEEARKIGYQRIILDSHHTMTAAHAVYEAAGFRRVAPWEGFPEHLKPIVVFMEMAL